MDQYRRIEAWIVAEDILNSILNEVVLTKNTSNDEGSSTMSSDVTSLIAEDSEGNTNSVSIEDLPPLSDSEREQDKTMRLSILQKLLELACAMVTLALLNVVLIITVEY